MKILYALRHRATAEPARAPRADTEQEHLETLHALSRDARSHGTS